MKTKSLPNQLTLLLLFSLSYTFLSAQAPPVKQWDKTYGGTGKDKLRSLQQTTDGGYILGGFSFSGVSGNKTANLKGWDDFWVAKIKPDGTKQWDNTYGGSDGDELFALQQTSDGGYILGGYSESGISGSKTENCKGFRDFYVVKIKSNGNKEWDKDFGGNIWQELYSLQQTSDGGYILGGYSSSGISGDKTDTSRGGDDYWIVKIDANGNKQWDKTFGGSSNDGLTSLQQTPDGGYILGGYSGSNISGDKTAPNKGGADYWIVKIDVHGNKQWDKSFGGSGNDGLNSLEQTADGGYILGGDSQSGISGDKTESNRGDNDYWIVKIDVHGNKKWDKTYGGSDEDELKSLQQTSDGGYILGGSSFFFADQDIYSHYWIVKVDSRGNYQWDQALGGGDDDGLWSLKQTSDEGYILGGESNSGINYNKTAPNRGDYDYWVIKLAAQNIYYHDADQDGYGNATDTVHASTAPAGYVKDSTDCDDHDNTIYPGAPELCDGKDNNCNGVVDENCTKITINNVSTTEGNSGQTQLKFRVHLSTTSTQTIKVDYTTKDGTAKAPGDYTATSGTLTFMPGVQNKGITILVNGDMQCEGDEVFKVKLSNPVNATLKDSVGKGTILNDDGSCIVSSSASMKADVNGRAAVVVTPNPASSVVSIRLNGFIGTATIRLISLQGKVLRTIKAQGGTSEQFSVADIASGTYFLAVMDEQGTKQTVKVVVVH